MKHAAPVGRRTDGQNKQTYGQMEDQNPRDKFLYNDIFHVIYVIFDYNRTYFCFKLAGSKPFNPRGMVKRTITPRRSQFQLNINR